MEMKRIFLGYFRDTTTGSIVYTAFTRGIKSKWIYHARTAPNIDHLVGSFEEVMQCNFLLSQGKMYLTIILAI